MKKTNRIVRLPAGLLLIPILTLCLLGFPWRAAAAERGTPETFSRAELAQMLAPVALYPDALLAQVLMAATYPLEVVEADRWAKRAPDLKGEALDRALVDKAWDPSVKALCHFPSVLGLMSEHLTETTDLGNAFLAQEDEVMDVVQELRTKARARGNLKTTSEQRVVVDDGLIMIEPVSPRVVYVPYYDPFLIYGPWWYPAYPPYYWGPVDVHLGFGISFRPGIYFGFSFGSWSYFDWPHRHIYIDHYHRPRFVHHDHWLISSGPWRHEPLHRRGVVYRDRSTASRYDQPYLRPDTVRSDVRRLPAGANRPADTPVMLERQQRPAERLRYERERRSVERTLHKRQWQDNTRRPKPSLESDPRLNQRPAGEPRLRQSLESDPRLHRRPAAVERAPREPAPPERFRQRSEQEKREAEQIERDPPRRGEAWTPSRPGDGSGGRPEWGREERRRDAGQAGSSRGGWRDRRDGAGR